MLGGDNSHTHRVRVVECEAASDPNRANLLESVLFRQLAVRVGQQQDIRTAPVNLAAPAVNYTLLGGVRTPDP
jgi:hypothetical protein